MESLIHPREKLYFGISLVMSVLIYLVMIISIVGLGYIVLGAIISFIAHGLLIGSIKGNGIKISDTQFPEVYQLSKRLADKMGLDAVPDIYIIQSDGALNAFATKFLGRRFVVIFSEVFELAYHQGEAELAFIICHEFAHLKRKHVTWRMVLFPSMFIPFLSSAYSRACEYTCDKLAAYYQTEGAENGLLILAAGKKLYRNVNVQEYVNQAEVEGGFWVRFAELMSTHPNLPKRIKAVRSMTSKMDLDYKSVAQ